jgi:O-acetyl-ADP-ribose deacetylase (regulator of RNase III)
MIKVIRSGVKLQLLRGDITTWAGDAIVNAANELLLGGGGVDGAIHRAAGPELLEACLAVPPVRENLRCPTGEARVTQAFGKLRCRQVIHTVGPIYEDPEVSAPLLEASYRSSLMLANKQKIRTLAFPAISCGVYGYPLGEAAPIALDACAKHAGQLESISFVLFNLATYNAWQNALTSRSRSMFEEAP